MYAAHMDASMEVSVLRYCPAQSIVTQADETMDISSQPHQDDQRQQIRSRCVSSSAVSMNFAAGYGTPHHAQDAWHVLAEGALLQHASLHRKGCVYSKHV